MEKITSHQVVDLMEAYNAVYTPQINEEQIQEDFEIWVNSLVEEGYDLSEFTWDEMYENYLNEYAAGGVPGSGGAVTMYSRPRSNSSPVQSRFARPMNAGTPQTYGGGRSQSVTVRPPVASLPSSARQVTQYPQGVSTGVGGGNAGASRQAPAARPAAPAAARPPAATTGNPPLKPPALPPVPGRESLASQSKDLGDMIKKSQARQGLTQSFDPFDVVLGHLIDEGYADTEESALQIMANMSEEWKESIVEEDERLLAARKKSIRRLNAAKNIEDKQADGDYENSIDHSNPTKGKSGYMEVPTDYRARKRRASGR